MIRKSHSWSLTWTRDKSAGQNGPSIVSLSGGQSQSQSRQSRHWQAHDAGAGCISHLKPRISYLSRGVRIPFAIIRVRSRTFAIIRDIFTPLPPRGTPFRTPKSAFRNGSNFLRSPVATSLCPASTRKTRKTRKYAEVHGPVHEKYTTFMRSYTKYTQKNFSPPVDALKPRTSQPGPSALVQQSFRALSRCFSFFPVFPRSSTLFRPPPPQACRSLCRNLFIGPQFVKRKSITGNKLEAGSGTQTLSHHLWRPSVLQFPTSPTLFVSIRVHPWLVNPQSALRNSYVST